MNKKSGMIAEVIALYISSLMKQNDSEWEVIMKEIYLEDKYIYDQVFYKLEGITNKGERWLTERKYFITTI